MTYVISDLHGYPVEKFKALLEMASFSSEDTLYILGDVIDRGPESIELLSFIMGQRNMVLLLGNHEKMMLDCEDLLVEPEFIFASHCEREEQLLANWQWNGGDRTMEALSIMHPAKVRAIVRYLQRAPLYKEITVNGQKYLLCHAGLGNFSPEKPLEAYTEMELLWNRPNLNTRYFEDRITVFGHTMTNIVSPECNGRILRTPTWIDIDTGAAIGRAPTLLRLDDGKTFRL